MKRLAIVAALLLASCTDDSATVRTLQAAGFTDIQTTGWSPWVCGRDDSFETGFRAKNPHGQVVEGAVCCGFLAKGCTVRF